MAFGQFSDSADKGARMGFSTGICGAELKPPAAGAAGMGENGIGAAGTCGRAEEADLTGAGGTAAAGATEVGATGAGRDAGATVFGTKAGGGVTDFGAAVADTGSDALGGGIGAALAGSCAGVKLTPCAWLPNGPATSSANSTFFTPRRDSKVGLIREMISLSGNAIWRASFSVPELANNPGRAARSSPKVTLTEPRASCERTFSTGMETNALAGGVFINFARRSIGNPATMDDSGNCRPLGPAAGAGDGGAKTDCAAAAGDEARASVVREAAAAAMGRSGATVVAPPLSKRRSSPRSNPANFDFTMLFVMTNDAMPVS